MNYTTECLAFKSNFSADNVYDISLDVYIILTLICNCVLIQLLCLIGIMGNILTVIVLICTGFKSSTNIALFALAASDLLYSITESLHRLPYIILYFDNSLANNIYSYISVYIFAWNQYLTQLSTDIVVVIAVERMIAVWFPFKTSQMMSPFRMGCIIFMVIILLIPLYLPYALYTSLLPITINNKTTMYIQLSQFGTENGLFYEIHRKYVLIPLNAVVPTVTIIVCSVLIIYKLMLSSRKVKKLSSNAVSDKREKDIKSIKITLLLCFFVVALVLVPSNTIDMYFRYTPNLPYSGRIITILFFLLNIIYQINASINFIIYVIFNSKFYKTY